MAVPIIAGEFQKTAVRMVVGGSLLGVAMAEAYRRLHTEPHKRRRTEYYRRLGVEFKSIVD
jgi:hypothetical protein